METKEFEFAGTTVDGFIMLFVNAVLGLGGMLSFGTGLVNEEVALCAIGVVLLAIAIVSSLGLKMLEPNEARVLLFFGRYRGTFTKTGFYWVNPFLTAKKVSLRARNIDTEPIKVNDKIGNPIMIGMILVWKVRDTYKAMFDIDSQAATTTIGSSAAAMMNVIERFVRTQSDAALREVAGQYAYDDTGVNTEELTLRGGGEEINQQLEEKLGERLSMAGIEVVEARINYLAYAPEIAAVMLRRQQASAIITAREKIVEGAVSMVKMALNKLQDEDVVELDEEKKAAMVSNLLVVLCGDDTPQPVVNTGTLNH